MEIGESLVTRLAIKRGEQTLVAETGFSGILECPPRAMCLKHPCFRYGTVYCNFLIHLLIHSVSLFLSVLDRVLGIKDRTREQSAEMHLSAQ